MPSDTAKAIPFEEFVQRLETIFDESEAQGSSNVLVERDGTIFSVRAARRTQRRSRGKPRREAPRYSLLDLIGIGTSAEPTDIGRFKHEYLAEAAADLHETPRSTQTSKRQRSESPDAHEREHDESSSAL